MRKKLTAMMMTSVFLLSAAGCAKTPDTSLVTQKNNDRLKEDALNKDDENRKSLDEVKQNTTEHYTFDFTSENGKVHITADAQVAIPEATSIPMYSLVGKGFTQEQATAAYDYLLAGKETWVMTGEDYSKELADQDLLRAKQAIADIQANDELSEEGKEYQISAHQDIIDDIEAQYDDLPEKTTPKRHRWTAPSGRRRSVQCRGMRPTRHWRRAPMTGRC